VGSGTGGQGKGEKGEMKMILYMANIRVSSSLDKLIFVK
jgi:hypothetical protein